MQAQGTDRSPVCRGRRVKPGLDEDTFKKNDYGISNNNTVDRMLRKGHRDVAAHPASQLGVQEHMVAQVESFMASGVLESGSAHGFSSGMTVQTSGSSHLCFKGRPWSRQNSPQFKERVQQTQRCVNSLHRGSRRTGLVTFFFLNTRKNLQYKCNMA